MGAIFISYRRSDADGDARSLFKDLRAAFGDASVFMDVSGIERGVDFRKILEDKLESCSVLLAVMGRQWLDLKNDAGKRRLDDDNDFVRMETAAALRRGIPVIPVLVQNAQMPTRDKLPKDLKDLAFRNGVELTHARWDSDVQVLVQDLTKIMEADRATARQEAAASYQSKVTQFLSDGVVMPLERKTLDELRDALGLTPDEASAIEAPLLAYQARLQTYRQDLAATLEHGYPLSDATRDDLQKRAAELQLKPEDAERIDRALLDAAEAARLQQHLAQQEQQAHDAARRSAESAARKARQLAEAQPAPTATVAPAPAPVPAPAPKPVPAPSRPPAAVAAQAAAAAASTSKATGGERLMFAAIGAAVCALGAALPYLFVTGTSDPEAFIVGSAIWGAVTGALSTSMRWIVGLAVVVLLVNLLGS